MKMSVPSLQDPIGESATCQVFLASDLCVTSGANLGDTLGPLIDLCEGDIYRLNEGAAMWRLALNTTAEGLTVAPGSDLGTPGERIELNGRLTFMVSEGAPIETVILTQEGMEEPLAFLPMAPIEPRVDLTLIGTSDDPGEVRLSDLVSIAFLRGTEITLANGQQCAVEDLRVGDRVLTRDHGAQPLRWIGRHTVRAVGAYAPVVISKNALGNASDLVVSQHQRLFVYQRGPDRVGQTAELLVKAEALVDDQDIYIRHGGTADYFSLVFDDHAVIYAECIPAESLHVTARTRAALPADLAAEVEEKLPGLDQKPAFDIDVTVDRLDEAARQKILRRGK